MFQYRVYDATGAVFGVHESYEEAKMIATRIGGWADPTAVFTGGMDIDEFEDAPGADATVGVTVTDILTETRPGTYVTAGVAMDGNGHEDPYKGVTAYAQEAGLAFPFMGGVGGTTALTRFAPAITGLGWKRAAAYFLGFIGLESLVPGDVIPLIPGVEEIVNAGGTFRAAVQDQLPGGLVPGERRAHDALMAALSSVAGVEVTAMTHMESGAFMGSYYPSPGARKKRGVYIGPGGSPIRTWANRGHAVISRDPRGSSLGKGAAALQKATSRYIKADRVSKKVSKKVKK